MWSRILVLAAALAMAPSQLRSADLVVWWEKGYYTQEDEAVREVIAAFEQKSGKQVELVQSAQDEMFAKVEEAFAAGHPPDFLFTFPTVRHMARWAYEDRLADLENIVAPSRDLFDSDLIEMSTLLNGKTGRRGLYALPMGRNSIHVHVWTSLLERAGFTLADIPKTWEEFWSFWCDRVQPAVRRSLGRDNIWGTGLAMSSSAADTDDNLLQFELAYDSAWLSQDQRPQFDRPGIRAGIIRALGAYTELWRKGCTPPGSVNWTNIDNNKAFLAQTVVMTPNTTLSIPGALRRERPDDYYRNAATVDWPNDIKGQPLVIDDGYFGAVVFNDGGHTDIAKDFVRFLTAEGWLAHWLDFAGDRLMPPMRKLIDQPFWLDPSDPHRMRAAIQIMTQPHITNDVVRVNELRSSRIWEENVWPKAVHRVATEGVSPEQAVDEAIARIKEILQTPSKGAPG
jgi:multiple sugar transport system substrate-binding protein